MRRNGDEIGDGRIALLAVEDVTEPPQQRLRRRGVGVGGNPGAAALGEGADVVQAMHLIGMVMREQQGVHPLRARRRGLLAKFGRGVDHGGRPLLRSALPDPPDHH